MDVMTQSAVREDERESSGFIQGLVVATVTDNRDSEGLARVRVRLPWQEEGDQSYWAPMVVPMALKEQGTFFLPDVGERVVVAFEQGDPTHPRVLGSSWEGGTAPPKDNGDGKNDYRLIRSRKNSELAFFDGEHPTVELKLEDGKHLLMDSEGITLEDGSGNQVKIESGSGGITIKSSGSINLESQTISIKAGASMELKASGTLKINGALVQIN